MTKPTATESTIQRNIFQECYKDNSQ